MRPYSPAVRRVSISLIGLALLAVACSRGTRPTDKYVYVPPRQMSDGLAVGSAIAAGIDTARVGVLIRPFLEGRHGNHTSLLVMKDGRLIVEEYFRDWNAGKRHTA